MESGRTGCACGYSPYIDSSTNALNPCFLSLVSLALGITFVIVGGIQLLQLCKESKSPQKFHYLSLSPKYIQHLSNIALQGVLILCQLIVISQAEKQSPAIFSCSLFANFVFVVFVSLPTKFLQYFKSTCALSNQLFYYLCQVLLLIVQISLRLSRYPDEQFNLVKGNTGAILEVGILINSLIIFLNDLCFYEPSNVLIKYYSENNLSFDVNIFENVTFTWMNKLITDTYRLGKLRDPQDLPSPPADLDIQLVSKKLGAQWESEKWKGRNSLLRALLKTFGRSILIAILYETIKDILSVLQPQILRLFILCFDADKEQKYPPLNGLFIALGLFFTSVLSTFLQNQFYIKIFEVGLDTRGSLIALTYQKSLKLSLAAREKTSAGDILNMASADANKIQKFFEDCQVIVGAPIQVVGVIVSLYWLLGKATLAGLVTMIIMIPINSFVSKKVEKLYKIQMKYKDARIRTTNEIINSMKSIKLYAWEEPMLERLNHVRNDLEMQNFKKIGVVSNLIFFLWNSVPLVVTCSTFGIFSLISEVPLSPEIVFPALSLFNILNDAIYSLPSMINSIIETKVSLGRLKDFFSSEELDDSFRFYEGTPVDQSIPVVEVSNATFLWNSVESLRNDPFYDEEAAVESSKVALKNINEFQALKGAITCIVGRVGSGKSTLLKAILGQLPCIAAENQAVSPNVTIRASSIAYCAQEAWIMNATIKENILFGHKYDEKYYYATIKACQLLPDINILPDGEMTLVGEKGITLSGGQKARVSLARAVYARADLYILDDVLSAVDSEVRNSIINQVLDEKDGLLKNKTIVLATNTISLLRHSKMVYVLQEGQIVENGTYHDAILNDKNPILNKLLSEFDSSFKSKPIIDEGQTKKETNDIPLECELIDGSNALLVEMEDEINDRLISRRASMASFEGARLASFEDNKSKGNQQTEKTEKGRVKLSVYVYYIKACGILGCVLFFSFMILSKILDLVENLWLKWWSEQNAKKGSNQDVFKFVGIYALIGLGSAAFNNLRTIIMLLFCSVRASTKLHDSMAQAVMRAPMSFFETTPVGRIINRFSSDMQAVDSGLQMVFSFFFRSLFNYLLSMILISYNMPLFLAFNVVLLAVYFYYQAYYITLGRELKRLNSISVSPIMSLFGESLEGQSVINAFDQLARFSFLNYCNVQFNVNCNFHLRSTNRWLSVRLQTIGALTVLITALLALMTINTNKQISPGMIGLLMSYALQVTSSLLFIVRMSVQIETNIVSVERIYEYCNLTPEAPAFIENNHVDEYWPTEGRIVFKQYSTKYREDLQPVLKNINIEIKPKEKIGVVGRTGAGKSTLSLALFRLLEPTEGSIEIDDIDICSLGLSDLRSHMGIIPQDAATFEGTVRSNLDPFNRYTDDEIWRAIELSHLKPHIVRLLENTENTSQALPRHRILGAKIKGQGGNLSLGERQLLCLSRALLNDSKVLILDEATAAVDMETDRIIQETIRSEFKDRTILTIAHRLDTVLDSDKILVLDNGEVKEFDTPKNLLSKKESLFYKLYEKNR